LNRNRLMPVSEFKHYSRLYMNCDGWN
jgi:hypothetical protein